MNIKTAADYISRTLTQLEQAVGESVFDEWAIVQKVPNGWMIREYDGDRSESFQADFNQDIEALKQTLDPSHLQIGDFAFSHDGHGSGFDAHICAGENLLILFNNTEKSTGEITKNPNWIKAQIHFSKLLERFITDPIVYASPANKK